MIMKIVKLVGKWKWNYNNKKTNKIYYLISENKYLIIYIKNYLFIYFIYYIYKELFYLFYISKELFNIINLIKLNFIFYLYYYIDRLNPVIILFNKLT